MSRDFFLTPSCHPCDHLVHAEIWSWEVGHHDVQIEAIVTSVVLQALCDTVGERTLRVYLVDAVLLSRKLDTRPTRIVVGLLFACHGAQKLFGVFGGTQRPIASQMGLAGPALGTSQIDPPHS